MKSFSTRQVARKLGIGVTTLSRYIALGKVPAPEIVQYGDFRVHAWTEAQIERIRALLPNIADGRKTRHLKKAAAQTKTKKKPRSKAAQGGPGSSTVPHEKQ